MDELFGDENEIKSNEFESFNESNMKTTTIEAVMESGISPIKKAFDSHFNYHNLINRPDFDTTFNKSKSTRKYVSLKKSFEFSPVMKSTPKPSKTRKSRKKSNRKSIGLWDKAIEQNPELRQWIDSFNEDMKKVESSELSVSQSNISFNNSFN